MSERYEVLVVGHHPNRFLRFIRCFYPLLRVRLTRTWLMLLRDLVSMIPQVLDSSVTVQEEVYKMTLDYLRGLRGILSRSKQVSMS